MTRDRTITPPGSLGQQSIIALSCVLLVAVAAGASPHAWVDDLAGWTAPLLLAVAASAVGVHLRRASLHRRICLGVLAWVAALLIATLGGAKVPGFVPIEDRRFLLTVLGATAVPIAGLLWRRPWGRWVAIGLGCAGTGASLLHVAQHWGASFERLWMSACLAAGFVALILHASARSLAAQDEPPAAGVDSPNAVAGWLRASVVCGVMAVPVLASYGWVQPGRLDALTNPALFLAGALVCVTALTIRGKAVGALGLVLAGAGVLALSVASFTQASVAWESRVAMTYAVFWIPAGLVTIACGVQLARPVWNTLTTDP